MLVMFILGLILIGMIAVAAQGLSGMYSALNDMEQTRQERQVEMLWESSISALLVQAGPAGEYVAPLGSLLVDGAGLVVGQGLPQSVSGPKVNSKGYSPLYCALGRSSLADDASALTVSLESGISYRVQTTSVGAIDYVSRSSEIPGMERGSTSIVAFIISPLEKSENISCSDIRYDQVTGQHSVPGMRAKVVPIYGANGGTLSSAEAINRSSIQFIDASSYTSINEALAPFLSNPPARITLNLPARQGGYALSADISLGSEWGSGKSELIIQGAGATKVSGNYLITAKNMSLALVDVDLDADLRLKRASLSVSNSTISGIDSQTSQLNFTGNTVINGLVTLDASQAFQEGLVDFRASTSTAGPLTLLSSQWKSRDAEVAFSGSTALYGIWLDQASQFVTSGSSMNFVSTYEQAVRISSDSTFTSIGSSQLLSGQAGTFLDIKGKANIEGGSATATGSLTYGAVLRDAGQLLMDNGQQWFYSGTPPAVGVSDTGGIAISGANAAVGGQTCWDGYLFSDSSTTQVTNNNNKNLNGRATASWSCIK